MAAVADLERLLERLFERTSARIFHSRLQPVQMERRVERAMEAGRQGRGEATAVPSRFRVRLHPVDIDDLAGRTGGPDALAARLADSALAFARLHRYHMATRPTVSLVADPSVERGRIEVDASHESGRPRAAGWITAPPTAGAGGLPAPGRPPAGATPPSTVPPGTPPTAIPPVAAPPPAGGPPGAVEPRPVDAGQATSVATAAIRVAVPPDRGPVGPTPPDGAPPGIRNAGDHRYTVRPAAPPPARALLRITEPGGRERVVMVEAQPLTLGRAADNGVVIADGRVSRHHGRFQTRHGALVYTDLGSTNGSRVNGIRVDELVLGAGDRLQVGDAVVVVEQLPG